jgi:CCR4-NOT transcriptional regulation complex NOT5 subunit
VEYYIESNQETDFKENDLMYEEIDMDNLSTIMAPVVAVPTTQSHPSSLCNGTSSSLNSATTLMDMSTAALNMHSHSLTNIS